MLPPRLNAGRCLLSHAVTFKCKKILTESPPSLPRWLEFRCSQGNLVFFPFQCVGGVVSPPPPQSEAVPLPPSLFGLKGCSRGLSGLAGHFRRCFCSGLKGEHFNASSLQLSLKPFSYDLMGKKAFSVSPFRSAIELRVWMPLERIEQKIYLFIDQVFTLPAFYLCQRYAQVCLH